VNRFRPLPRRAAAIATAFIQLAFLLLAAAPRMAWCHRPGGDTVLEFEISAGECHCDECAMCRERGRRKPSASPDGTTFRASHCRHNEIDSEAGRSSDSLQASSKHVSASALVSAAIELDPASPAGVRPASLPGRPENDTGPSGAVSLRC